MTCAPQPRTLPASGPTMGQVIALLLVNGYKPVGGGDSPCRTFRDATGSHLLTLSDTPALAAAFCRACGQTPRNPHLPKILAQKILGPNLHVRVSENLLCSGDYASESERTTRFGHARAFSTLFEGDEMHRAVHLLMVSPALQESSHLIAAIRLITACGKAFCNTRPSTAHPVRLDPRGSSVMFRPGSGEAVFANPLIRDENASVGACRARLEWVEARFSAQELDKPSPPYWHPA